METFTGYLRSELRKNLSLPVFWVGAASVIGISCFFATLNLGVINEIEALGAEAAGFDGSIDEQSPFEIVSDALLAASYQASVMFVPVLVALLAASEYQRGQWKITRLITGRWSIHVSAQIIAVMFYACLVTVGVSVVNAPILLFGLPPHLAQELSFTLWAEVTTRTLLVTMVQATVSLAAVTTTKKAVPSLAIVVGLFLLAASGILNLVSHHAHNLLPLIGAKSFAFGRQVDPNDPTIAGGALILYGWLLCAIIVIFVTNRRKVA
ncbi:hypothetical protein [Corynebacterium cystitidis]|uniref:hypothetical protein n=1 Tax=Corynebacterium cystitidis TaxID=35757 RepID=UPI00211E5AA7|nr:hypothetical protein [Corynebacterium cystitidis]